MQAILFALVSYFTWGIGDVFDGLATRKIGTIPTMFWLNIFGQLFPTIFLLFSAQTFSHLTLMNLGILVLVGILFTTAGFSYIEGLRVGNASIVGTIGGSFTSLVVVFSILLFGEVLTFNQAIAILIIFVGVVLCSLNFSDLKGNKLLNKGTLFALFSMVAWGIGFTIVKIPIRQVGWFWPTYLEGFVGLFIVSAIALRNRKKNIFIPRRKDLFTLVMGSILPVTGYFSFNYAISIGQSSIVAPIAGSSVTLFVLVSRFAFKDRLTRQQWVGIIVTLAGIIFLAFISK